MVKSHINELLEVQIIRDRPYASPIILVREKDSGLHIYVDYQQLDAKTRKDAFLLPCIKESLNALAGPWWFSIMDLASWYNQVLVAEKGQARTTFCTPFGLFEWNQMVFGLYNVLDPFQQLMERLFGDQQCQTLLLYLDDIVGFFHPPCPSIWRGWKLFLAECSRMALRPN